MEKCRDQSRRLAKGGDLPNRNRKCRGLMVQVSISCEKQCNSGSNSIRTIHYYRTCVPVVIPNAECIYMRQIVKTSMYSDTTNECIKRHITRSEELFNSLSWVTAAPSARRVRHWSRCCVVGLGLLCRCLDFASGFGSLCGLALLLGHHLLPLQASVTGLLARGWEGPASLSVSSAALLLTWSKLAHLSRRIRFHSFLQCPPSHSL